MFPSIAVITNIEEDHLDCYRDLDDLLRAFAEYINRVPFYGSVIVPAFDKNVTRIREGIKRPVVTFGFDSAADVWADQIEYVGYGSRFNLVVKGKPVGQVGLRVPGRHNVANALAAAAAAFEIEVPFEAIEEALRGFQGVGRRFQIVGEVGQVTVIDDYAHHPSEIQATLEACRQIQKVRQGRTLALFQPHLFSRTRDFYRQFAEALHHAHEALVVDIYPAREKPLPGIAAEMICAYAVSIGYKNVRYVGLKEDAAEEAAAMARANDIIITMGAGDIFRVNQKILKKLAS